VLDFLIRVTAEPVVDVRPAWTVPAKELTTGDQLFFLLVQDAIVADSERPVALRSLPVFAENPLGRLAFPSTVAAEPPDYNSWFTGTRAAILECLQPWLASKWLAAGRAAGRETDWAKLAGAGRATAAVIGAFLAAADHHGRRDLARFVLRAASRILTLPEISAEFWSGGLFGEGPARLQERVDVRKDAMALPVGFAMLENWTRSARRVGYFDEGYATSQMWKEDWEAVNGDTAAANARRVLTEIEPLQVS
jgi:hypothetical protein